MSEIFARTSKRYGLLVFQDLLTQPQCIAFFNANQPFLPPSFFFLDHWKVATENKQNKTFFSTNIFVLVCLKRFYEILTHHHKAGIERNISLNTLGPCHQDMQSMHENTRHLLPPLHYITTTSRGAVEEEFLDFFSTCPTISQCYSPVLFISEGKNL